MRRFCLVLGLLVMVAQGGSELLACGDKFLVLGRGARSQRIRGAAHPATIVMYLDPKSELPQAMKDMGLETDLKLAGHKLRSVRDRRELDEALRDDQYDLVLVGISDMVALEPRLASAPSRPALLPIIYNPTGEELRAAEKQYRCVLKSPSKRQHFLAVIDDAMVLRAKAARAQSGR